MHPDQNKDRKKFLSNFLNSNLGLFLFSSSERLEGCKRPVVARGMSYKTFTVVMNFLLYSARVLGIVCNFHPSLLFEGSTQVGNYSK